MGTRTDFSDLNDLIAMSDLLSERGHFDQAVEVIESNLPKLPAADRLGALCQAFNVAKAKGDTELAKRFVVAIAEETPAVLEAA